MIRLTLPLPPNRANAREHWRVTWRRKRDYYDAASYFLAEQELELPYGLERPTLTATLYVWAKMDPDNATARLKWPIDCLVMHGILVDDSEKHLDFTQIPKQVVDRKNRRVEIVLATPGEES